MFKKVKSVALFFTVLFSIPINSFQKNYEKKLLSLKNAINNLDVCFVDKVIDKDFSITELNKIDLLKLCDLKIEALEMGVVQKEKLFSIVCRYASVACLFFAPVKIIYFHNMVNNPARDAEAAVLAHKKNFSNNLNLMSLLTAASMGSLSFLFSLGIEKPNKNRDLADIFAIKSKIFQCIVRSGPRND